MSARQHSTGCVVRARRFAGEESGATLVEFGLVLALLLLIAFGIIDFGRLAFHFVAAEKAVEAAARIAAVRPPACSGVALINQRGTVEAGTTPPRYGSSCGAADGVCLDPGNVSCTASASNATATEVWSVVSGTLPIDATIDNVLFRYDYDSDLGFLGGPYVPVVTVELQNLNFTFVSPLSQLAALAVGGATAQTQGLGGTIAFPDLSASLPGEDLAQGGGG
jgi:Flp pilus assembly protein TadG